MPTNLAVSWASFPPVISKALETESLRTWSTRKVWVSSSIKSHSSSHTPCSTWAARSTLIFENEGRYAHTWVCGSNKVFLEHLSVHHFHGNRDQQYTSTWSHFLCTMDEQHKQLWLCHVHYKFGFRKLTHKARDLLAKQFLTVFSKCGGSEKKRRSLPSVEYGLGTLWVKLPWEGLWILNRRRLGDAPSAVTASTFRPQRSMHSMACQSGSNSRSPDIAVHGNCAYWNSSDENRPRTINIYEHRLSQLFIAGWSVTLYWCLELEKVRINFSKVGKADKSTTVLIIHQIFFDVHLINYKYNILLPFGTFADLCYLHELLVNSSWKFGGCIHTVGVIPQCSLWGELNPAWCP